MTVWFLKTVGLLFNLLVAFEASQGVTLTRLSFIPTKNQDHVGCNKRKFRVFTVSQIVLDLANSFSKAEQWRVCPNWTRKLNSMLEVVPLNSLFSCRIHHEIIPISSRISKRQLVEGSMSIKERFGERFNRKKSNDSQKQKRFMWRVQARLPTRR